MQHTPKPWYAICNSDDGSIDIQTDETVSGTVEHICTCDGYGDGEAMDVSEDKANAHLISASPDLLEACEAMIASLDNMPDGTKVPTFIFNLGVTHFIPAIKKAKGE